MKLDLKKMLLLPVMTLTMAICGCNCFKPSQEKLFEEYKQMYAESASKTNFAMTLTMGETVAYATRDANGFYVIVNNEAKRYYVKKDGKYYDCREQTGLTSFCSEITQQKWQEQQISVFDFIKKESVAITLDGDTLEEMIESFKGEIMSKTEAVPPLNPTATFSEKYSEDAKKDVLLLEVRSEHKMQNGANASFYESVQCYDNVIKRIYMTVGSGESTHSLKIDIEYVTNASLVPSNSHLDNIINS